MGAIKKTISISEDLIKAANDIAPNFSAVVEAALTEYIHHYRVKNAIDSFGKWQKRKEKSVDIVNDLRREDERKNAKRSDRY